MRDLLIPRKISYEKVRFGNKGDGGYIFAKTPVTNQKIHGFGVFNDISCEVDMKNYFGGEVDVYDGEEDFRGELPEGFKYHKMFITGDNINQIVNNGLPSIVKMDIEGWEFDCINKMTDDTLKNIEQFIVEFHLNDERLPYFYALIHKLLKTHKIFHIHGNNCCGVFADSVPRIVELSFINRNLCNIDEIDNGEYPVPGLDYKNIDYSPLDHSLGWPELLFKWW